MSKGFFGEFKEFIARGNVMDMAVGVIIGGAFKSIVDSLVADIIMPVITLVTGGINFQDWFISLDGKTYNTLAEAQDAGASTLNYGNFITYIINFLILALVIFIMVRAMNKHADAKKAPEEDDTKVCPYCKSKIPKDATRCPNCTSQV